MKIFLPVLVGGFLGLIMASALFFPAPLGTAGRYFASLVFPEQVTPEILTAKYEKQKPVRILIVPGHDHEAWGTDYRGVREADLTLQVGQDLKALFAADPRFEAFITRDEHGYVPEIAAYFKEESSLIEEFRNYVRTVFLDAVRKGAVTRKTENNHGTATNAISQKLYGINLWANDNRVDIVLHLHFNDYPRRGRNRPGTYAGFSIYVPEAQLPNARVSRAAADAVAKELRTYLTESTLPQEEAGVVEDQELIAVGSYASLNPASLVIEYGYIYEPMVTDAAHRPSVFKKLALLTYEGVRDFLASSAGKEIEGANGVR